MAKPRKTKAELEAEYASLMRETETPLVERRRTQIRDLISSIERQERKTKKTVPVPAKPVEQWPTYRPTDKIAPVATAWPTYAPSK